MDGRRCRAEDACWVLWQLIYQRLGCKEDRRNFAHTCKNVHDAVLQEVTSLELHLQEGVPACLSAIEAWPKPFLPGVAGPSLKQLTIGGRAHSLRPKMLPFMRAMDGSALALHHLQSVVSLTLKDVDIGTDLLGWSIQGNCPNIRSLELARVDVDGSFWETLAPLGITRVCLTHCRGLGIIRGLSTLKSLTHVMIEGPWSEEVGALSHCPRLTYLRLEHRTLTDYAPSPGLASVLRACPLTDLHVPDFAMLHECGSVSVRSIHVDYLKMGEPHGSAHDFKAKFPALQDCTILSLALPNNCPTSEAAVRAERVRQSAFFLAALAQAGVQVYSAHCGADRLLELSGYSWRSRSEVNHALLSALSPLSGIAESQPVRVLGFAVLNISGMVMQTLAPIWPGVSLLYLSGCSICEPGLAAALGQLPALTEVVIYDPQAAESTARATVTACVLAQGSRRSFRLLFKHKPGQEEVRSVYASWKARCDAFLAALPGPHTVSCHVMVV